MPNRRILYGAQVVFVSANATGSQASGAMHQLHRVQSTSYDFTTSRQDVNQFGQIAAIDRVQLDLPTVSLNCSYLSTNVRNESGIGLYVGGDSTILRDILNDTKKELNYYVRVTPDGIDAVNYAGIDGGYVGIGNGVLSSYQAQGQVGSFPTAQFTVQALNFNSSTGTLSGQSPAIDPSNGSGITNFLVTLPIATSGVAGQATALRPGDITLSLSGAGIGLSNVCLQSYNLQIDLNLDPIICLGSKYPTSREVQFPITAQLSVDANMADLGTGNLTSLQCNEGQYSPTIYLRAPSCDPAVLGAIKVAYTMRGAVIDSQSWNDSIGPSKSLTISMSAPISASGDNARGIFMYGSLA